MDCKISYEDIKIKNKISRNYRAGLQAEEIVAQKYQDCGFEIIGRRVASAGGGAGYHRRPQKQILFYRSEEIHGFLFGGHTDYSTKDRTTKMCGLAVF